MPDDLLRRLCRAKRDLREAKEWVQSLKDLGETDQLTIHCACNAVIMYQDDVRRIKDEALAQGRVIH